MIWYVNVNRGATQPQGVQNVLSYDGQDRSSPRGRSRPESEGAKPSSGADYSGRWPREGGSGATDADFGGNGSSSDTNEGTFLQGNSSNPLETSEDILSTGPHIFIEETSRMVTICINERRTILTRDTYCARSLRSALSRRHFRVNIWAEA